MIKVFAIIGVVVSVVGLLGVVSLASGTIVWMCWDSLHTAFPGIENYVAQDLSWWSSVKLAFLFGCLIKATQHNTNR